MVEIFRKVLVSDIRGIKAMTKEGFHLKILGVKIKDTKIIYMHVASRFLGMPEASPYVGLLSPATEKRSGLRQNGGEYPPLKHACTWHHRGTPLHMPPLDM